MRDIIWDPGQDRIVEALYAWVAVDPKTQLESLCAIKGPLGFSMQAATTSPDVIRKMSDQMRGLAAQTGKRIKLVKFSNPEVLETI